MDYDLAQTILEREFVTAEGVVVRDAADLPDALTEQNLDAVFASRTQAYREVLLGCILARLTDSTVDVTRPYAKQGDGAYNGRSLDETVVNPFLEKRRIPSSRSTALALSSTTPSFPGYSQRRAVVASRYY